jgi:hypothetical protein
MSRLLLLLGAAFVCAAEPARPYYAVSPGALAKAKAALQAGDAETVAALKKLVADADKALKLTPPSVTAKQKTPPSGDKHDYMSLAPYFWPNPAKADGLPYVRRDGKVNPEAHDPANNDTLRIRELGGAVETLALAYHFTGKPDYAAQAARFLRVWCLDEATRMTPRFAYAQAVLGVNDGRGTGILEARSLVEALDAASLLAGSPAWTAADQQALDVWSGQFLDWLLTSKPGKDEFGAKNNHGTWYDVQTAKLALVVGRREVAQGILRGVTARRTEVQFEATGKQPLELARTASFGYSCFNLVAHGQLAVLGEHAGVDLWRARTQDGRSPRTGLDFMLPYLGKDAKPWPFEQIRETKPSELAPLLRRAAQVYAEPKYAQPLTDLAAGAKRLPLLQPL